MNLVIEVGVPSDDGGCTQMTPVGKNNNGVFRQPFIIYMENPTADQGSACSISTTTPLSGSCACGGINVVNCFAGKYCYGSPLACLPNPSQQARQSTINDFGTLQVFDSSGDAVTKQKKAQT